MAWARGKVFVVLFGFLFFVVVPRMVVVWSACAWPASGCLLLPSSPLPPSHTTRQTTPHHSTPKHDKDSDKDKDKDNHNHNLILNHNHSGATTTLSHSTHTCASF